MLLDRSMPGATGRDTGDAQIHISLVDNRRLDPDYQVFSEVLRGMEVVERILEGDFIERIEIRTANGAGKTGTGAYSGGLT